MNENIQGLGIDGSRVLHVIPVEPDKWHGVDIDRPRGICIYNREFLITRIADLIATGQVYSLDINNWRANIDRAGNVWLDHEYLAPHQYLPKMITP